MLLSECLSDKLQVLLELLYATKNFNNFHELSVQFHRVTFECLLYRSELGKMMMAKQYLRELHDISQLRRLG